MPVTTDCFSHPAPNEEAMRLLSPFGPCIGVAIGNEGVGCEAGARQRLAAEEAAYADVFTPLRARCFVAGRLALREAFAAAGLRPPPAVLPGPSGAPILPSGVWASISHKSTLAIAIAAPAQGVGGLGIDLEHSAPSTIDIGARVLLPQERAAIAHLPQEARLFQTRLAFSLKEAIYKAAFPVVQRFFGFHAAQVELPVKDLGDSFVPIVAQLLLPDLGALTLTCAAGLPTNKHIVSLAQVVKLP